MPILTVLLQLLIFNIEIIAMTYISIDTKSKQAQKFVELLETLPFAKIIKEPNALTKNAINEARKGKTVKAKSVEQLFNDLRK